jgi:hypothetical protein
MTAAGVARAYAPLVVDSRLSRVWAGLRNLARRGVRIRLRCLVLGHEDSFARDSQRLRLRCATCGRETAGWTVGPGASAVMATPDGPPSRGRLAVAAAFRWWPWVRRLWQARRETRERQRLRMVVAAARASERRPDDGGPGEPRLDRDQTRPLVEERQPDLWTAAPRGARAGLGDYGREADGSATAVPTSPQGRSVPSQKGSRAARPQRPGSTDRRSIM